MEKNQECEIVQDLLIGYADNVLKPESKKLVEKHLAECEKCKKRLEEIQKDVNSDENCEQKQIDYFKKVKKKLSKKNKIAIIIGIALAISLLLNIMVFVNYRKNASYLQIYLTDEVSEEDLADIEQAIKTQDSEAEIEYHSKEDELKEMEEKMGERANLLDGYENNLATNPFPASFVVKADWNKIKDIEASVISMPGVKKVSSMIDHNPYAMFIARFFIQ